MTTSETYIPHPVVVYFFVAPSQKLVRWNYASIRDAKKAWHVTRLQAAANAPLQPWTSSVHWRYTEDTPKAVYTVEPMNKPVLRYEGGDVVPPSLLGRPSRSPLPWHRRRPRNRRYKEMQPAERTVARRLRHEQRLDPQDPGVRPSQRVHRTYWEDAWTARDVDRNWKRHRKTQWKE